MLPTAIIPAKNVPYRPRVYTDSFLGVELSNKLSEESCKGSKFTDVHSAPLWTQLTVKLEGKSFRLLISLPILTVSCCSSFLSPLFLLSFLVHDVSCYIIIISRALKGLRLDLLIEKRNRRGMFWHSRHSIGARDKIGKKGIFIFSRFLIPSKIKISSNKEILSRRATFLWIFQRVAFVSCDIDV